MFVSLCSFLPLCCRLKQGPRGKPGDAGPRGVQGEPVSADLCTLRAPWPRGLMDADVFQGDPGQRGAVGEAGPSGGTVRGFIKSHVRSELLLADQNLKLERLILNKDGELVSFIQCFLKRIIELLLNFLILQPFFVFVHFIFKGGSRTCRNQRSSRSKRRTGETPILSPTFCIKLLTEIHQLFAIKCHQVLVWMKFSLFFFSSQGLPGPDGRDGIPGLPGSKVRFCSAVTGCYGARILRAAGCRSSSH